MQCSGDQHTPWPISSGVTAVQKPSYLVEPVLNLAKQNFAIDGFGKYLLTLHIGLGSSRARRCPVGYPPIRHDR
jgi:hypothetical protein